METRKSDYSVKRSNSKFKKKGSSRKGRMRNPSRRYSNHDSRNLDTDETSYRILCPSTKIGGVIGRGGGIINALRDETHAKITVSESIQGSDERVILIYSSSEKITKEHNMNEDSASENEDEDMEPHCPAQDALLKIHDRITDEDRFGGMKFDDEMESLTATVRLLVSGNMVGCLIGKQGDVIEKLRRETGANIRVLPAYDLPACALKTDELVLISGQSKIVKQTLYRVSTLLHEHPRKDKLPSSLPGFRGRTPRSELPSDNISWPQRNSLHGIPALPWMEGHVNLPHGVGFGSDKAAKSEFCLKILCPIRKIGGVIGKGGFNVKQLEQETGASIHVEESLLDEEERVIQISSFETLMNPRSRVIDAALLLQHRIDEHFEKGISTTRLLVPSSKVGCIIGQGGEVINEMRRRIQADIRVFSKEDKPTCASAADELVQVSGSYRVARDALAEIASRLRTRCLRASDARPDRAPPRPIYGYNTSADRVSPPLVTGAGRSGAHEFLHKGTEQEYATHGHMLQPSAIEYPNPITTSSDKFTSFSELGPVDYTHAFGTAGLHQQGGYGASNLSQASYPDTNSAAMQPKDPSFNAHQQPLSFYPHSHTSQPLPIYPRPASLYSHATSLQSVAGGAFPNTGTLQGSYY